MSYISFNIDSSNVTYDEFNQTSILIDFDDLWLALTDDDDFCNEARKKGFLTDKKKENIQIPNGENLKRFLCDVVNTGYMTTKSDLLKQLSEILPG
jgi:hypothetical protein